MSVFYPDISHYHPVSDWAKVKASCPFLISKATQGTNFIDSTFSSFISGCEANHIPYWLYTYLNAGNETAQAQYLVNTCKGKVGSYFRGYVLDIEAGNAEANVIAALKYLEGLGYKCIVYTMYAQYNQYRNLVSGRGSNTAWWEARYGANNGTYNAAYPCHTGVDLHQFTSQGTVAGISGKVDLNRLTGTKAEAWFTGATTTAAPAAPSGGTAGTTTSSGFDTSALSTVKSGSKGAQVKALQLLLNGKNGSGLSADGIAGSKTIAAIKSFQKKNGLSADGICGKNTWNKILGAT